MGQWHQRRVHGVEPKVEEETCHASSQRHQSFYQGALRLQGQASFKNCESLPHEEAQGDDQLRRALWQRGELLEISVLVIFCRGGRSHQANLGSNVFLASSLNL